MSQTKTKRKSKPARRKLGKPMKGCEILVAALEREGVDILFAYPGGASMELHQALTKSRQIRTILPRHEQGGAFAAGGYARASGKVGVCMATSGPGATNLVTGIADAWMDSVPLVALTGQVPQAMIGKGAFQETDFYGMTLSVVKHSYLITDIREIPRVVKEAFHIAHTGRPGPVVIDFPKNIQQQVAQPVWPDKINLTGYNPSPKADDLELNEIIGLIEKSERPVLYVGGGIITGNASKELRGFVEATKIPVTTTIMGVGVFPEDHKLSLRWLGMHGAAYANWAVSGELRKDTKGRVRKIADGADLLLAFGVRFDDRVTGDTEAFAPQARGRIVHIDIDPASISKNVPVDVPIVGDVGKVLELFVAGLEGREFFKTSTETWAPWRQRIATWKKERPLGYESSREGKILPKGVFDILHRLTGGDALVTTDVGQHQMWTAQMFGFSKPRSFLTSGGLGTMGYGLPAAIGAWFADSTRPVLCISGDGSVQMNMQELSTAVQYKVPIKLIILNNRHLGMVRQWQDKFYERRFSQTYFEALPDFVKLAEAYGALGLSAEHTDELEPALVRLLEHDGPGLIDIAIPSEEGVFPMVPAGMAVHEMLFA